jgi:protein gp37
MQKTKIEWTKGTNGEYGYVWNPVTGCEGKCQYCYARKMANRLKGRCGYPADKPFKPTFHMVRLWETFPAKQSKIFVSSMGDLFGDWVQTEWINRVLDVVRINYKHTFIFLTKNPKRYSYFDFPINAWIGYSTTGSINHKWDTHNKDNVKFVSIEPLGEQLSIRLNGYEQAIDFDWLIVGKETGNRKEKLIPKHEWIEEIIDFTAKTGIRLFIKDNLNHIPVIQEFPKKKMEQ